MYRTFEHDGYCISLNENFLKEHMGKEFLDIGIQRTAIGKIERDNIAVEISYEGFGVLIHKRTNQSYDNILLTEEKWGKVKAHFRENPDFYDYTHCNMRVKTFEGDIQVGMAELITNKLAFSVDQLLIRLYVQHVACKTQEELISIREKKRLPFNVRHVAY